jgi:hypothetical protein
MGQFKHLPSKDMIVQMENTLMFLRNGSPRIASVLENIVLRMDEHNIK